MLLRQDYNAPDIIKVPAPFLGEWDFLTAWKLACIVRRYKVDIIHAHTGHAHLHACLANLLAGQGKVVVTRRVDFRPADNAVTRWKYARAHRIVAVSHYVAQVLRDYGVEPAKLAVIHSAQDPARFEVEPIARRELAVPEGAPLLVCVAALVEHKDHGTLLDAMPLVLRHRPEVHLLLVGNGPLRPHIERQIKRLKLESHVHLLGHRDDVPRILRAADLFVLPSKMEGLGGACLEAMLAYLPVVACAAGGVPEFVRHLETGLLVPPGDSAGLAQAILRVLGDGHLASKLVENGRKLVLTDATVTPMLQQYLLLYEETLAT